MADTSVFVARESGRPLDRLPRGRNVAATALHWEAELRTQDGDFRDVPGLTVVQL
ncbi:MAG: hypothetical protein ACTHOE_04050 [Conexibacter sp.]